MRTADEISRALLTRMPKARSPQEERDLQEAATTIKALDRQCEMLADALTFVEKKRRVGINPYLFVAAVLALSLAGFIAGHYIGVRQILGV